MQPLPLKAQSLGQHRISAIGDVARAGMVQCGEVHPDLMGATGFQVDVEQACRRNISQVS